MVKAILGVLKRSPSVTGSPELLASRVADKIEEAAEIFDAHDDPMPVSRVREIYASTTQASPEDLGQDAIEREPRGIDDLPQPVQSRVAKAEKSLIVLPGSAEARQTMQEAKTVQPIRVARKATGPSDGEEPQWDFQELYAEVMGNMPPTIEVTPNGTSSSIALDRTFQADPASGIVKATYTLSGQRDSAPSTPDNPLAVVAVPMDVSTTFSIFMPRDVSFRTAVEELKVNAAKAFAPRPEAIVSNTRRISGGLEGVYRRALGVGGTPQSAPPSGNGDDADSSTPVFRGPEDHWDPARAAQRQK